MKNLPFMIIATCVLVALSSYAQEQANTLMVVGQAEEAVAADVAYVTVYASADGILMVDAVKKADTLVREIVSAIEAESNVVRSIKIQDVVIAEKQTEYWRSDQKDEIARPQVVRRIQVVCEPDATGIYEVIDKAIRAGALMQVPSRTSYSGDIRSVVMYGLEHSDEAVNKMRAAAMVDAKVQGEELAALTGKKIGDVISMSVGTSPQNIPCYSVMRVMGVEMQFPSKYIGVNADQIPVRSTLSVTFELTD